MTRAAQQLKIAFYGDDFTGSTDALECLDLAGIRSRLYLEVPTRNDLAGCDDLQGVGVAGRTRSLPTARIEQEIRPALERLRELNPRHVHYKVCSTFDSSPQVGSIGRVIDAARSVFPAKFVPVLVASPSLGRWSVFGSLFARYGIGSQGRIYRLDRHPAMSGHPTTPADESDLTVHLSRQTDRRIGLVDVLAISQGIDGARAAVEARLEDGDEVIFFDALTADHMQTLGMLLDEYAGDGETLFSVGSSGIETALGDHWKTVSHAEVLREEVPRPLNGPLLVVSGSCSPVTSGQIEHAISRGFVEVAVDVARLFDPIEREAAVARAIKLAAEALGCGRSVIVPTYRSGKPVFQAAMQVSDSPAATIGAALGQIARECMVAQNVALTCLAGGDTSSYAAREMGIVALDRARSLVPGAPICRIHSPESNLQGQYVVFKGGQVGAPDFFAHIVSDRSQTS